MMELYMLVGAALFFIFIYGALILCLLNYDHKDMLKRPYLMFCFGSGGIASSMFLLGLLRIPFGPLSSITVCLILLATVVIKIRCARHKENLWTLYDHWPVKAPERPKEFRFLKKVLCWVFFLIILTQIFYVASASLLEPESGWDARARWGLKAKILYSEKNIYIDYFKNSRYSFSHPYYPLLVPFEMAHMYFFLGDTNDRLVKSLFAIYFFMLLVAFYDLVRRCLPMEKALFFTALLATVPGFLRGEGSATTSMADMPLTFYCFSAATFFLSAPNKKMIALATGIVLFFCAFTKSEGFFYSLIFIFNYVIAMKIAEKAVSPRTLLGYGMLVTMTFIVLCLPWLSFKANFIALKQANFPPSISFGYVISKIHRLSFIVADLMRECLQVKHWHIVWLLFFFSLLRIFKMSRFRKELIFLLFNIAGFFAFYTAVYMLSSVWGSQQDESCRWMIHSSIQRLMLPLAPVALLFSVFSFCAAAKNETR